MNSIDFIDETGREWAHASRYRVLGEENSALRKRVEELEQVEADLNAALDCLSAARGLREEHERRAPGHDFVLLSDDGDGTCQFTYTDKGTGRLARLCGKTREEHRC